MTQPTYIFRSSHSSWSGKPILSQSEEFAAFHPEIRRAKGKPVKLVDGFPAIQQTEGTGRYNKRHVIIAGRGPSIDQWGRPRKHSEAREYTASTAEGVKATIRRLREREAEELDVLDEQIKAAEAALLALREQRKSALSQAWQRANVVRLSEVMERIK